MCTVTRVEANTTSTLHTRLHAFWLLQGRAAALLGDGSLLALLAVGGPVLLLLRTLLLGVLRGASGTWWHVVARGGTWHGQQREERQKSK